MIFSFQSSRSLRTATIRAAIKQLEADIISILAVLADRDLTTALPTPCSQTFQSSRSLRTATTSPRARSSSPAYFNPRGPCGPRRRRAYAAPSVYHFNPRGPCGPRPNSACARHATHSIFQSSRSLRTATTRPGRLGSPRIYFNPRGPCGPRPAISVPPYTSTVFQSSRSLRTATGRVTRSR